MKKILFTMLFAVSSLATVFAGNVTVTDTVTTDTKWTADNIYTLKGYIFVKKRSNAISIFDNMKVLFSTVTKKTGCVVIAASGGREAAVESDKFNNSAFTYVFNEGLSTRKM